jgi:hypothetical protein
MTNATKTLAIIFAGTLALAAAATWSGSGSSSAAFRQQLVGVDTSAVQAVEVAPPDAPTVRLERTDGAWSVGRPAGDAYPARASAVERLLTTLPELQVRAVATRQPEKHPRYGVDSTGTTVRLLGGDDAPLRAVVIGRTEVRRRDGTQQSQSPMQRIQRRGTAITYVRPADQSDVYSVEASLGGLVNKDVEAWREKTIWTLARSDIQRVHVTTADSAAGTDRTVTIQRAAPRDTASTAEPRWVSAGDTLATGAASSLLSTVASPRADGFAETRSPDDLSGPAHTVRLRLSDGRERTLRLYPSGGDTYLATAPDYPYVAEIPKRRWDDSVLRPRSALLK